MPPVKALGRYTEKDRRFTDVVESQMILTRKKPKEVVKRVGTCISTFYNRLEEPEKMTVRELRAYILELKISEKDILDFLFEKR